LDFINDEPKKVYISKDAYERIVIYSSRYARPEMNPKEFRETYGILVGYLNEQNIPYVKDAIPVLAGTGAGVQYESKHYVETAKIDESLYEKFASENSNKGLKYKEFFIGWWHTHPGFGFFFSETDTITQLGWQQANPYAIAIIYDCLEHNSHDAGIEVLHLEDVRKMVLSPYKFIDFELEDNDNIIKEVLKKRSKYIPLLQDFELELEQFNKNNKKKNFAQLQRNYGLLDVIKRSGEMNEEEFLNDEEKYLYEWNDDWLKKKYRKPKFLEKIEKSFQNIEKLKSQKYELKIRQLIGKIDDSLKKPLKIVNEIDKDLSNLKKKRESIYNYLDLDEISSIENFESRFNQYKLKLNEIKEKINQILKF